MNLFVIPSWYPHRFGPASGIFFKEQALAIGALRPEWNIAISLWGQQETHLAISRFYQWPSRLSSYVNGRHETQKHLRENVTEYKHLTFTWNRRFGEGNIDGVLRANERNLRLALQDVGSFQLIHAHVSFPAGWIAMNLSEKYAIPYVITEHMSPFPFPEFLLPDGSLSPVVKLPLKKAKRVIAVSPSLGERLMSMGIDNVSVVPNVIDESYFITAPRKDHNVFSFFTLGNMIPQKGIPVLLSAIGLWMKRSPDLMRTVRFRIGGTGEYLKEYQILARNLGVSSVVEWLGGLSREQVREEFQNCECFVLPSLHETFGVVLAEAAACGKPVIATKCGGPESIVTKENGLLVAPGDSDELSEALQKMTRLAKTFSPEIIREDFVARFSRKAVVDALDSLYSEVLRERAD
jgi:glycosyltransferase involved in cell wall biosynthesis